jgi:response regulator RpfG family c-di-GMP phosphodiesterase
MVDSLQKPRYKKILSDGIERENITRLQLCYEVSKNAANSSTRLPDMLEQVIMMTQSTLNAEAASVLLFRDNDQELFFEAATGPVGKALRAVTLNTQYGIAGQVVRTGKPLIVNDVSRSTNFHKMIDDTTGFITKSLVCAPLTVNHKTLGVIEVLNKRDSKFFGEQDLESVISVATTAAMAIENTRLQQTVTEAYKNTITALAAAIDAKDPYTRGHSERVMEYALKGGTSLSFSSEEMENLEYAGILHDIGKIAIDCSILNKPGPLNSEEWQVIRAHPVIGAELLKEVPFLAKAAEFVLHHHEKHDGTGYPSGLKGNEIPLGARLIAVADAFDTMTTDRAYRSALPIEVAVKELHDCSGSQFCPTAVEALLAGLRLNITDK